MGNSLATTAYDVSPNPIEERKELDLSQPVTHKELCKHLEGSCSSNCLSAFPWDVLDATWMYERLLASCNCLMTVPPELPLRLPHLTHLDLDYNHLSSLPNSVGLFVHLQTLLLRHNSLDKLPSSIARLPRLRKLDLSYNRLTELPAELGAAPRLAKINVSHNKLEELPLSLGCSDSLTVLLAQGNQCKVPPQDICDSGNSEKIIAFLRKAHDSPDAVMTKESVNVFPRVRGNDATSSSLNPHSTKSRYVKSQTQTTHTTSRVRTPLMPPPGATTWSMTEIADKIVGLIYGAVIGDALGLATEFMSSDECRFYYDSDNLTYKNIIRDEHTVHWQKGEWTSNSDQMLLVLNSLLHWAGMVDELDFAQRLVHWKFNGLDGLNENGEYMLSETIHEVLNIKGNVSYADDPHGAAAQLLLRSTCVPNGVGVESCNGHKKGIGSSSESEDGGDGAGAPCSAIMHCDNGSLPRATILGVPDFHNLKEVASNSVRICLATHADERCVAANVAVSVLVALLLQGRHVITHKSELEDLLAIVSNCALKYLSREEDIKEFKSYMAVKDYESVKLHEKGKVHFVFKPLAATVVALRSQRDVRCALSDVILQGGHGSINGCIAGAVLGCSTGYLRLPKDWVDGLARKRVDWLNDKINHLLDMMGLP